MAPHDMASSSVDGDEVLSKRPDISLLLGHFGTGGVERVACLLANGFVERGLGAEVIAAHAEGPARGLLGPGITVVSAGVDDARPRVAKLKTAIPSIARHLRHSRPSILLSPGNHTHVAAGLAHRMAGRRDISRVVKITNPFPKSSLGVVQRTLSRLYYRWLLRRADLILVLSPNGVAQVRRLAGEKAAMRTRFVRNPYIPLDRPAPAPARLGDEPLLVAVGRLSVQKNYLLLLDAVSRLTDLPWRLALLGEGPQEQMLRARARELGIEERVDFLGFVPDPGAYYMAAKCLVISSKWEDLPAVAMEAMGLGCPVVATDCSKALTEIIDSTGFGKIVPLDPDPLASALREAISSPSERRVPPQVELYSIANGVEEHFNALQPLLGAGPIESSP